jgi:hypothetical protein
MKPAADALALLLGAFSVSRPLFRLFEACID